MFHFNKVLLDVAVPPQETAGTPGITDPFGSIVVIIALAVVAASLIAALVLLLRAAKKKKKNKA